MEINESIEILITDMAEDGRGIGRTSDGMAVFVSGAVYGDTVIARTLKRKKRYALARAVEIIKSSEYRISNDKLCPYIESCGGCAYGMLNYDAQLKLKVSQLENKLRRIADLKKPIINPVIAYEQYSEMKGSFMGYRNKAVIAVGQSEMNEPILGFREAKSHRIVGCKSCRIQLDTAMAISNALKTFMLRYDATGYDEISGTGLIRYLIVRTAPSTGEVMAVIVVNGEELKGNRFPNGDELSYMLSEAVECLNDDIKKHKKNKDGFYSLESIVINKNSGPITSVLGEKSFILAGRSYIRDELMDLEFDISPESFYQVNSYMTAKLYEEAIRMLAPKEGEHILDVYCGIGTIGLIAASRANARFLGIESVTQAVRDANKNAIRNGIVNAEFIEGRAEEVLERLSFDDKRKEFGHPQGVILDPPRAGCNPKLIDAVIKSGPERIVYISCDQGTLARDIRLLGEGGYELKGITPCDMFPETGRLESVSLLVKKV